MLALEGTHQLADGGAAELVLGLTAGPLLQGSSQPETWHRDCDRLTWQDSSARRSARRANAPDQRERLERLLGPPLVADPRLGAQVHDALARGQVEAGREGARPRRLHT